MNPSPLFLPKQNYSITYHDATVEAWLTRELQFMPKDWQSNFKSDLQKELVHLSAEPNQFLHAIYASSHGAKSKADIENVLFYNVGLGHFHKASKYGIRFERAFKIPKAPHRLTTESTYYHRYFLTPARSTFHHSRVKQTIGTWNCTTTDNSSLKFPTDIWFAVKHGFMYSHMPIGYTHNGIFGIRALLTIPSSSAQHSPRLIDIVKPIFDGVISAFQQHDGSQLEDVSMKLAQKLPATPEHIQTLLMSNHASILQRKRILHVRASSIQWSPDDHLCYAGELYLRQDSTAQAWTLQGDIFEVSS